MVSENEQTHFYITPLCNASQKPYSSNTLISFTEHLARPIDLGSNSKLEVGVCEVSCHPYNVGTYANLKDMGVDAALIYCDVIAPQFVGSQYVRVLRTFIHPSTYCNHTFDNIYYVAVEKGRFQDIEIRLLRLDGRAVGFFPSATHVKIVLHFRRVSHW
jgi:hypothetical protein